MLCVTLVTNNLNSQHAILNFSVTSDSDVTIILFYTATLCFVETQKTEIFRKRLETRFQNRTRSAVFQPTKRWCVIIVFGYNEYIQHTHTFLFLH